MSAQGRPTSGLKRRAGVAFLAVAGLMLVAAEKDRGSDAKFEKFDHGNFGQPTRIDNPWLPLRPGMRYVYEGTAYDDEGDLQPVRVEIHVTDLVKVVDGIASVVTWDLDYADGELVESEIAFFAQDDDGNVWRMGEHPEEYDDGEIEAPTWLAGVDGAKAGIEMLADPRAGTPSYSQGWAPKVEFTDRGQVDQVGQSVQVPVGHFDDVLVIAETSEEEGPNAIQLKYFARGMGNVKVGWRGEDEQSQEVLDLIEVQALDAEALAEVRAKALKLDEHAYEISKDVYAKTAPAKRSPTAVAARSMGVASPTSPVAAQAAPTRNVSDEQAKAIAIQTVPGEVTDIAVERKFGKKTIVVEVMSADDFSEIDVIIDMETGAVLGTEN